jgi:hypothetical protein
MRYVLLLFILGACFIYPSLYAEGYVDGWIILGTVITATFQIVGSIWLYKDFVGWDKFEYSEGLRLKRKKKSEDNY